MAVCGIKTLFLFNILWCSCLSSPDPYCVLDSENQYYPGNDFIQVEMINDTSFWNDSMEFHFEDSYEDEFSLICPIDADTCVSFPLLIEQCQMNSSATPGFYCNCDAACEYFDDCCHGYEMQNTSLMDSEFKLIPERQYWSCSNFVTGIEWSTACFRDFLVVGKCPASVAQTDPELVKRCEIPTSNDTVFFDPQEVFYRNRYCALCHGVNTSSLTPYIIFAPCLDNGPEDGRFCGQRTLTVDGSSPPPIRWCVHDDVVISECIPQEEGGESLPCLNRSARVMVEGDIYKNINCARCNGVVIANTSDFTSDCTHYFNGRVIVSNISWNSTTTIIWNSETVGYVGAFEVGYYYPQLQCMNGLQLSGTECIPAKTSWPVCRKRTFTFAVMTNGSLQCFGGFQTLKIEAYYSHPNATVHDFQSDESDGATTTLLEFPANILPHKTQIEEFIEYELQDHRSVCCRDNNIVITERCDIADEIPISNHTNLTWIHDDLGLFEPVVVNGSIYIMYNRTIFVTPLMWENTTKYKRLSRKWEFTRYHLLSLYGEVVDFDTCAYFVVGNDFITENHKNNITFLIYDGVSFPPEHYIRFKNGSVRLCWTGPEPPEPVSMFNYSRGQYILNLILVTLSCICLLSTLFTYCFFKCLRNLQGTSIMNFAGALFLAQVMLHFVDHNMTSMPTACLISGIVTHYLLLAVFTWTNILAWDLARHFASSSFIPKKSGDRKRLMVYLAIGWCLPLAIVIPCLIVQVLDPSLFRYGKIGTMCWIYQSKCIIMAFLLPVAVSFVLNVCLFSMTAYGVRRSKRDSSVLRTGVQEKRKELFKELVVHFKISCLLGFGWSFGFIAAFAQATVVWTIFIITSSLQGIFVFIFFGLNRRVKDLWRKRIHEQSSSSSGKGISSSRKTTKTPDNSTSSREKHGLFKIEKPGSPSSMDEDVRGHNV